ncbi:hypothetical protein ACFFQF_02790 [Haladaptatus pallidirubidus]|uniref:hypothetical protein n=1 Tax=Haladaptatus pallidirubidus TaxID=1008152 RepID=UPI0035E5F87C
MIATASDHAPPQPIRLLAGARSLIPRALQRDFSDVKSSNSRQRAPCGKQGFGN